MGQDERRRLARALARIDGPEPDDSPTDPDTLANPYLTDVKLRRQRRLALLVSAACCVFLAGWIVVLRAMRFHDHGLSRPGSRHRPRRRRARTAARHRQDP
jgi:hypothetical protein